MTISCNDKKLSKTINYQVLYNGCDGVLEVIESCPYVDKKAECRNCYGKICKLTYEEFDSKTGKFENKTIIKKDSFSIGANSVDKKMKATELQFKCSIIREIKNSARSD